MLLRWRAVAWAVCRNGTAVASPGEAPALGASNPRIRLVRALHDRRGRREHGLFLAEGMRLVEEALAYARPDFILYAPVLETTPRGRALLEAAQRRGVRRFRVAEGLLQRLCETVTPQGVLAVIPLPPPADLAGLSLAGQGPVLVLDRIADPGNAGTLLRSAEAAGAPAVLAGPGTVDLFSPKVVRASMGAHYRLPLAQDLNWMAIREQLQRAGAQAIWLAHPRGETRFDRADWTQPSALIIGGETAGPSPEALALATGRVYIPMAGPVESLNAAMAGTVLLFEALRQRLQVRPA